MATHPYMLTQCCTTNQTQASRHVCRCVMIMMIKVQKPHLFNTSVIAGELFMQGQLYRHPRPQHFLSAAKKLEGSIQGICPARSQLVPPGWWYNMIYMSTDSFMHQACHLLHQSSCSSFTWVRKPDCFMTSVTASAVSGPNFLANSGQFGASGCLYSNAGNAHTVALNPLKCTRCSRANSVAILSLQTAASVCLSARSLTTVQSKRP